MKTTVKFTHKYKKGEWCYVKANKREFENCRACGSRVRDKQVVKVLKGKITCINMYQQANHNTITYNLVDSKGKLLTGNVSEEFLYRNADDARKSNHTIGVY